MKISTGLANALLDTAPLKTAMTGAEIRLYSGPVPSSADDALDATNNVLLGTYKNAGAGVTFAATATNASITKNASEAWTGNGVADGTATFIRHVFPADDGTASTTAKRIQATCALAGADIDMTTTSVVTGTALQPMDYYIIVLATS